MLVFDLSDAFHYSNNNKLPLLIQAFIHSFMIMFELMVLTSGLWRRIVQIISKQHGKLKHLTT